MKYIYRYINLLTLAMASARGSKVACCFIARWCMVRAKSIQSFVSDAFGEVNFIIATNSGVRSFVLTTWHKVLLFTTIVSSTIFLSVRTMDYLSERRYLKRIGSKVSLLKKTNAELCRKFDLLHLNLREISRYFDALGDTALASGHDVKGADYNRNKTNQRLQDLKLDEILEGSHGIDAEALDTLVTVRKQLHRRLDGLSKTIAITGIKLSDVKSAQQITKDAKCAFKEFDTQYVNHGGSFNAYKAISDSDVFGLEMDQVIKLERLAHSLPIRSPLRQYRITSHFGHRKDPIKHTLALHRGLDLQGEHRSAIVATGAGKVIFAGSAAGYGNMVDIDHGYGVVTRYAHLEAVLVYVGDEVTPGFLLGYQGATGRACGEHLHYEVRYKGVPFNPHKFISSDSYVKNLKFAQAQ